jgi:hypothetical protein
LTHPVRLSALAALDIQHAREWHDAREPESGMRRFWARAVLLEQNRVRFRVRGVAGKVHPTTQPSGKNEQGPAATTAFLASSAF